MLYYLYDSIGMLRRMKSNTVRQQWRDVLDYVGHGGTVVVEHYTRPVARIVPMEARMPSTRDIADQVRTTLDTAADHFDIDGIVEEIARKYGLDIPSIDAIPSDEYWAIVEKHDTVS